MKKILLLIGVGILFSFSTTQKNTKIKWMTFEEAIAAQKKFLKKLLWMHTPYGVGRVKC